MSLQKLNKYIQNNLFIQPTNKSIHSFRETLACSSTHSFSKNNKVLNLCARWPNGCYFISRRRPPVGPSPAPPSDPSRFAVASAGPSWPLVARGRAWRRIQGWDRRSACGRATGMVSRSCSLIWQRYRNTGINKKINR